MTEGSSRSTRPDELSGILRRVELAAQTDPVAAAELATAAIEGLAVADEGDEGTFEVFLSEAEVAPLVGLARHVFWGDRAFDGGFVGRLPESIKENVIREIIREDVGAGEAEAVAEWIGSLRDHDTADVAKWELVQVLFRRYGAAEGFRRYPGALLRSDSDAGQARQRFSVLQAQEALNR